MPVLNNSNIPVNPNSNNNTETTSQQQLNQNYNLPKSTDPVSPQFVNNSNLLQPINPNIVQQTNQPQTPNISTTTLSLPNTESTPFYCSLVRSN